MITQRKIEKAVDDTYTLYERICHISADVLCEGSWLIVATGLRRSEALLSIGAYAQ